MDIHDIDETSFPTRESYLLWRQEWRTAYRTLSADIRGYKQTIAADFRVGSTPSILQMVCVRHQRQASTMMELRATSKKIAARRYAERITPSVAA